MSATECGSLTGPMHGDERARLVMALDHDVRQPQHSIEMGLRTLRLIAADLKARRFDESTFDSLLEKVTLELSTIKAAVRQVTDTQQDLFDAIRLESEAILPRSNSLLASDLIERVVRTTRGLAGDVEVHGVRSRLSFVSDERWVERILSNLVGNAIWHSHGSRILIGARRSGTGISFEVRDNGRGMPPDEVNRVLDPVRPATVSPFGSSGARSGLGLYNVGLFVKRLGGAVHCTSCPGLGTRFQVRLPGPVCCSAAVPHLRDSSPVAAARNKLVAALSDDLSALRTTELALERLGLEVYADHDPIRWLSVLTDLKRLPDLILLDSHLGMPRATLYLDILRRKWTGKTIRTIVLTGHPTHPSVRELSMVAPVLVKPVSDEKLKLIIDVLAMRLILPERGYL